MSRNQPSVNFPRRYDYCQMPRRKTYRRRTRRRYISVRSVRKDPPDVDKLVRALIMLAKAEVEAKECRPAPQAAWLGWPYRVRSRSRTPRFSSTARTAVRVTPNCSPTARCVNPPAYSVTSCSTSA